MTTGDEFDRRAAEIVTTRQTNDGEDVFVCGYSVDSVESTGTIVSVLRGRIAGAMEIAYDDGVRCATSADVATRLEAAYNAGLEDAASLLDEAVANDEDANGMGDAPCPYLEHSIKRMKMVAGWIRNKTLAGDHWGVWCVEDRAWCMKGTREEAEKALPDWASGRMADVKPEHFQYELRRADHDRAPSELLRRGGEWLGAARDWIKRKARNGESVTWGSHDVLEGSFTVESIESLAAHVASIAMRPQPSDKRLANLQRATWAAQWQRAQAVDRADAAEQKAADYLAKYTFMVENAVDGVQRACVVRSLEEQRDEARAERDMWKALAEEGSGLARAFESYPIEEENKDTYRVSAWGEKVWSKILEKKT